MNKSEEKKGYRMKTLRIILLAQISLILMSGAQQAFANDDENDNATVKIAIQSVDSGETTNEFESQARALGIQPLSEFLSQNGIQNPEIPKQFGRSLELAQEAWIDFKNLNPLKPPSESTLSYSIENFLKLEKEAEWTVDQKRAFFEFRLRLSQVQPMMRALHRNLAAISFGHFIQTNDPLTKQVPIELTEPISHLITRWISFSDLPADVEVLFVDGHPYNRSQGKFPVIAHPQVATEVRLTAVSNRHWPVTIILRDLKGDLKLKERLKGTRGLLTNHESCVTPSPFDSKRQHLFAIDREACRQRLISAEPLTNDENMNLKFGLRPEDPDPFRDRAPLTPVPRIKPWVWAAVGGIALSALLIAKNAQSRSDGSSTLPVHRSGW